MINWELEFWGNRLIDWICAAGIIFLGVMLSQIIRKVILIRLGKLVLRSSSTLDDFIVNVLERTAMPFLYFLSTYIGLRYLNLPAKAERVIQVAFLVVTVYFVIRLLNSVFSYIFRQVSEAGDNVKPKIKAARGILLIIKIILWLFGVIFIIDNLGYNITTLLTGLGIGGIAIALASQAVLGDLFSYLVIFFDKPFEVGDFITAGDKSGVVEYIGIKTTRLRTLSGEQLIISNTDLTNSRVQNFKRMEKRRVIINIGITYETNVAKLKKIPDVIKNIIEKQKDVQFDRAHFSGFGDFSLNFEIVFYLLTADYLEYMNVQQQVFFELKEAFEREKIDFAYPTQQILIRRSEMEKNGMGALNS